jgi:hypothetical protein
VSRVAHLAARFVRVTFGEHLFVTSSDYSTHSRELQRREAEQGLQAALNFTTAVHTSVSPKRRVEGSWGVPNHGSHSWFPVEEVCSSVRESLSASGVTCALLGLRHEACVRARCVSCAIAPFLMQSSLSERRVSPTHANGCIGLTRRVGVRTVPALLCITTSSRCE